MPPVASLKAEVTSTNMKEKENGEIRSLFIVDKEPLWAGL